jgi:hypothetical protein
MEDTILDLENYLGGDVFAYFGELIDGVEETVRVIIEKLKSTETSSDKLFIILTTVGGSLNPVKRIVNILRHHYKEVYFIVPDYAYSAGTVMCCSGDKIFMSYFSVLGPIDPQVQNKDGKFVAALGYLDKINELIGKAQNNTLTQAEFIILKDFDLAELRAYEQARDLAVELLIEWLPKYKFKDWVVHKSSAQSVSDDDKRQRAREIADNLSDNKEWKSHGRPINRDELEKLKLRIDRLDDDAERYTKIMNYYSLMRDYVQKYNLKLFMHTREFL